jgi:drug/metabolite transporter (DMT)-like permease
VVSWLVHGEVPHPLAMLGGGLILGTVVLGGLLAHRSRR